MNKKKTIGIIGAVLLITAFFAFGIPGIFAYLLGLPQIIVFLTPFFTAIIGAVMFWYGFLKK